MGKSNNKKKKGKNQKKNQKKALIIIPIVVVVAAAVAIAIFLLRSSEEVADVAAERQNPIVTIEMDDGQVMRFELYPDIAPNTVANFVYLAQQGFYDGVIFHRTIPGFMIQGGCPYGMGVGNPGYRIRCEVNELAHTPGVLSMAHAGEDTGGSQFFIMAGDAPWLDGRHTGFGSIIEGLDVVDNIVNVEVITRERGMPGLDRPVDPPVMRRVTVETFGYNWGEPEKLPR